MFFLDKTKGVYLFFMIYYELLMCLVLSYVFFIQNGNERSPSPQDLKIIIFICFSSSLNFYLLFLPFFRYQLSFQLDIQISFSQLITSFCAWLPKLETTTSTLTPPLFAHLKLIFKSCLFSFLKSFKSMPSFHPSNALLIQLTTMSGIEHHIPVTLNVQSLLR